MFCISCGAKLPDDARFCARCGTQVPEEVLEQNAASLSLPDIDLDNPSQTLDSQKSDARVEGEPVQIPEKSAIEVTDDITATIPPLASTPSYGPLSPDDLKLSKDATAKMPRIERADGEVLVESSSQTKNYIQTSKPPKPSTSKRVVLIVFVVILLALAVFGVSKYLQSGVTQSAMLSSQTDDIQISSSASNEDSIVSQSTSQAYRSEEERTSLLFEELETSYMVIRALNERFGEVVEEYNGSFLAADEARRQQAADKADTLGKDIANANTQLDDLMQRYECKENTKYYQQYQAHFELLRLLKERLDPLLESWKRSLASASPSADYDYIIEPLRVVNTTELASQFDSTYRQSTPRHEG